jgi:hypothetical protein
MFKKVLESSKKIKRTVQEVLRGFRKFRKVLGCFEKL